MVEPVPIDTADGVKVSRIVLELPVIVPFTVVAEVTVPIEGMSWVIAKVKLSVNAPPTLPVTLKTPRLWRIGAFTDAVVPVNLIVASPFVMELELSEVKSPLVLKLTGAANVVALQIIRAKADFFILVDPPACGPPRGTNS